MDPYSFLNKVRILLLILCIPDTDQARSTIRPNKIISFSITENRAFKKSLGYHEDTYLNFTELTTKYGYPSEAHTVTTEDGYILSVFRILPKCSETVNPYPVFLMHGLVDSADAWILAGPGLSLGFVLASNCYDVWAANHRGNVYSRRHVTLDPDTNPDYWNYSFDEHGYFDLPAVVDYILLRTDRQQVFYIGHSQGTTDNLVMNSLRPEYNRKVRLSILLAPVAWMKNIISPGPVLAAYNVDILQAFLEGAGFKEVLAKQMLVHNILEFLCETAPEICDVALTFSTGHKSGSLKLETLSVAFGHLLSGSSIKSLIHFAQLVVTGRFQRYDEGREGNIKRYGSLKPPEYNITQISCPVVLVSAKNDWVSSLKDVDKLSSRLPNLVENYIVPEPYWSHHNHLWGITTPTFVNNKILDYLERFK